MTRSPSPFLRRFDRCTDPAKHGTSLAVPHGAGRIDARATLRGLGLAR